MGKFQKGQSGNPGGRPKEHNEVKALAREQTEKAIKRLAYWMNSEDPRASVAASTALLDRAWGKPAQAITGPNDGPLTITMRWQDGKSSSSITPGLSSSHSTSGTSASPASSPTGGPAKP